MIVWNRKEGHRRHKPAKQVITSGEFGNAEMGKTTPTITAKSKVSRFSQS